MLEEGAVISVKSPASRRIARWWLIAIAAPILVEVFGWATGNLFYFFRAKKFGAPYWPTLPPLPWSETFEPRYVYFLAVFATLALIARFGDRRSIALGALLVLPLGYGTARSAVFEWCALPITKPLAMVPDCDIGTSEELLSNNRELTLENANRVELTGVRARWDNATSEIVLYPSNDVADAIAAHTLMMAHRTWNGAPCSRDAFIVDGQPRFIATVSFPILWGDLALDSHGNPQGHHQLFEAMTKP